MPQARKVKDEALLGGLARVFKDVGFEGASLAVIADASGLRKSSLYHRFPGGKDQMAQEVLDGVAEALETELFPTLDGDASPSQKMDRFVAVMDGVYAGGRESCLLNMLCPPRGDQGARAEAIRATLRRLLSALTGVAAQAGATPDEAAARAEDALVALQGSLVLARGADDPSVFQRALVRLPGIVVPPERG